MPISAGQILHQRYQITSLLGQGGMGAVYYAWDNSLNIPVALKVMTPDPRADPRTLSQLRQQFEHEARTVAALDHPNLVRVIDRFSWNGAECLVMNFIEGESLFQRIQRGGAQTESLVIDWTLQLLDALTYCHQKGVIHRDIKPQNVIITAEGKPVLVDFGLVKLWDSDDPQTRTVIRAMGTPEYAPPEQYGVIGEHTDARSDLYSLGATMYHALTGQAPMSASDRMARPERFVTPRKVAPGINARTEAAILKAMNLSISQRFNSAEEMKAALQKHGSSVLGETRMLLFGVGGLVVLILLTLILIFGLNHLGGLRAQQVGEEPENTPVAQIGTKDSEFFTLTAERKVPASVTPPPPTSTPLPTATQLTVDTVSATAAEDTVAEFQTARATAYSTWDTVGYHEVLAGDALESSLNTVNQLINADCRYYITDEEIRFEETTITGDEAAITIFRSETQRRVCGGTTSYTCYRYKGLYQLEQRGGRWFIVDKSVANLTETSPCP